MHPTLNIAVKAARKAGQIINRASLDVDKLRVDVKQQSDYVTEVDRAAEAAILDVLREAYPSYGILAEESGLAGTSADSEYQWIIDPLDGTTNFLHGVPLFAVAIALERNQEIVASVIYNPIMDELYTAEKGGGAWLSDRRRLRVANRKHLADALIVTGINSQGRALDVQALKQLAHVTPAAAGIRRTGSASTDLAWLAAGRFDGYWEAGLKPWDVAPGLLLVKEAGGTISDFQGKPGSIWNGEVVAGNESIQGHLLKSLRAVGG